MAQNEAATVHIVRKLRTDTRQSLSVGVDAQDATIWCRKFQERGSMTSPTQSTIDIVAARSRLKILHNFV
jgi:hypothetical protein